MKTIQKFALTIALIALFTSCQSSSDPKQLLANKETRKEIIGKIANDSEMAKEMMEAMMNNTNGKMIMQGNKKMSMMMMEDHATMMEMIKENPGMMQSMMSDMMEACKGDSSMMAGMCKTMMGNQQMMDMMQKMKGGNKDMKKMDGMPHKM